MSHPFPDHTHQGKWVAYACLALSMSMVGVYVALSKPLTAALPVFLLAWMRFGIAAIAMGNWLRRPAHEAPMTTQTKRLVFLESFIGNFMFSICMLFGVSMTSAVSAGVILSMIPAAIAILSWVLLKERVGKRVWLAAAFGALGIALLAMARHWDSAGGSVAENPITGRALLGNALVFAAVLCEGVYAVVGKKLTVILTPKRISALINLCGFLLMTPMGIYFAWGFHFSAVHYSIWLLLVFYAMAASVWTVWLWMTGLQTIPAARAGVFSVMLPITAAVVGVFVLGETLNTMEVIAFAIALAGVLLATLPGSNQRL
jgi:drug/metabolite transporter (DMT)-like permease